MNDTVLRLEDMAVGYGSTPLYEGVSLRVSRGELVTLLGANGAGKSTLLRCVTGRLSPMRVWWWSPVGRCLKSLRANLPGW